MTIETTIPSTLSMPLSASKKPAEFLGSYVLEYFHENGIDLSVVQKTDPENTPFLCTETQTEIIDKIVEHIHQSKSETPEGLFEFEETGNLDFLDGILYDWEQPTY